MTKPLTTEELLHRAVAVEKTYGVDSLQAHRAWESYRESVDMTELETADA